MSQKTTFATINQLQSPSLKHTEELEQRVRSSEVLLPLWAHLNKQAQAKLPTASFSRQRPGRRAQRAQNDPSGNASPGRQDGVNQHSSAEPAAVSVIPTRQNRARRLPARRGQWHWTTQVHGTHVLLFTWGRTKAAGDCPEVWDGRSRNECKKKPEILQKEKLRR